MSTEFEPINDFETLLELRIQLKKYKEKGAAHTLAILKRIKKASISREFITKTRVTRTIKHLSKLKYENPTFEEANMLKYSQFLINTWREKMFQKSKVEYPPINYKKPENNNKESDEKQQKKEESKSNSTKLPDLKNEVRNKGVAGIKKYLKNYTEESEEKMVEICVQLENLIFEKYNDEGKMSSDQTIQYKGKLKAFCTKLLSQKNGESLCRQITKGEVSLKEIIDQS